MMNIFNCISQIDLSIRLYVDLMYEVLKVKLFYRQFR